MAELPHPWGAYAHLQEQSRKSQIDDRAWGVEAGLNLIVASDPTTPPSQDQIDRTVASTARLERYRVQLRSLYLNDEESVDPNAALQAIAARQILQLIRKSAANSDWVLLCEVAAGQEYTEIAARRRVTAGSLRARVLRLRRSLVKLAA